ncbi:MAG: BON domain-containing protein [Chitinivibrionales bacterium]
MAQGALELEHAVEDHLDWDSRLEGSDIQVDVRNNTAHLSGTVPSYMARQAAGEDAMSIPGILAVDNVIEVVGKTITTKPDDKELTDIVKRTIDLYPHLDGQSVQVNVDKHEVTLTGDVDAFWKKLRAEELAFNVSGVHKVHNKLSVVPSHSLRDETVAQHIREAIDRTGKVDSALLTLQVDNGVVTLYGEVPDRLTHSSIQEIVKHTRGVTDIKNQLQIKQV